MRNLKRILRTFDHFLHRIDNLLHKKLSTEADPLVNPMVYDRTIENGFVIAQLADEPRSQSVLDIGPGGSALTTTMAALGFPVDAIDLRESPLVYPGVRYVTGDFLDGSIRKNLKNMYEIVVLCSTIEHFGLARYGYPSIPSADLDGIRIVQEILTPRGKLILTIPYGIEAVFPGSHKVYNKNGQLLQYMLKKFLLEKEEYYKIESPGIWVKSTEPEAARVIPTHDGFYALGLFVFRNR